MDAADRLSVRSRQDDEGLARQGLTHAHEVHPEMDLTEGQTHEMVSSQASDNEGGLLLQRTPRGRVHNLHEEDR